MKIFNTIMTTAALAALFMASSPQAYAGRVNPEEVEKNSNPCSPCATVITQPVMVNHYYIQTRRLGFANSSESGFYSVMEEEPRLLFSTSTINGFAAPSPQELLEARMNKQLRAAPSPQELLED